MSSLDAPEMTCRQCKNVHCAFNPICPHCGIGPEGPIIKAPDHRREIIQKTPMVAPSAHRGSGRRCGADDARAVVLGRFQPE
jgi:hypothetical protein